LFSYEGSSWSWSHGSWIYNYVCNQCMSSLKLWVRIQRMTRCDRYNIMWSSLSVGRWFSPGTLVSFTNKADRHDITEILLKVALNTITLTLIPLFVFCFRIRIHSSKLRLHFHCFFQSSWLWLFHIRWYFPVKGWSELIFVTEAILFSLEQNIERRKM
jgi:hypothetical protein